MKLTLGPLLYYWPRQATLDFYAAIAEAPVDVVYLGETVCSRRHELRLADWLAVAETLEGAGKEVVLSSQVLVESGSDLKTVERIAGQGRFRVEANDMGAVRLLGRGRDWVAGPTLNVFNHATLGLLLGRGAGRWVIPPEMSRAQLAAVRAQAAATPEIEVLAYGRVPLAISARCFTARHFNLQKDSCAFRCIEFADGLPLATREGEPFLTVNGVQTQSARVYNLLADLPGLAAAGVTHLRISPQGEHTLAIIDLFRRAVDGRLDPAAAFAASQPLMPEAACNGFWHGRPGLEQYIAA
jgi:O2-independent ubiquinone biosynthesis protein UbiV